MKFKDLYVSTKEYFSVGIEESSGEYYISIPVRNARVDYSEYYRIPDNLYFKYKSNLDELVFVAEECRKRMRDQDLFFAPGIDRGDPI